MTEKKQPTPKSKISNLTKIIISLTLWLVGIVITISFVWPMLAMYINTTPARGIDFYLTLSHVAHLSRNLTDPITNWWYEWYGGRPFEPEYPYLHFYGIIFFYKIAAGLFSYPLTLFSATQLYVAGSLLLFFISCYTLFYTVSRNFLIAIVPTLFTAFSYGIYTPIFWGGAVPYTATMFFYPMVLVFVYLFIHLQKKPYLYIAGLLTGLSLFGHPEVIAGWVIPVASLIILIKGNEQKGILTAVKNLIIYILITFACGFRELSGISGIFSLLLGIVRGATTAVSGTTADTATQAVQSTPAQTGFQHLFRTAEITHNVPVWINHGFFILVIISFIVFLVSLLLYRKRWISTLVLAASLTFYGWFFMFLYYVGSNPFAGGWYRVFWGLTVLLGLVISILLGESDAAIGNFIHKISRIKLFGFICQIMFGIVILILGWPYVGSVINGFPSRVASLTAKYGEPARYSSAYPVTLNTHAKDWSPQTYRNLVPSWLDPNRLDYRLYDMDATVNIWWNSLFMMPLVRGYLDSPGNENYAGWEYWMNIVLTKDEVVKHFNMPEDLAQNQAQFFLDWHAIRYLETGTSGGRNYGSPLSSYIASDMLSNSEEVKINPEAGIPESNGQALYFSEVKSELVSPIYQATNAPAILVIGDNDAQNTVMRLAGSLNLNTKRAIIVQGSQNVNDYSQTDLNNFQMIILYRYRYNNGSIWSSLEKYVEQGGTLFIDTGTEVNEATSTNLPALFPISAVTRKPLGSDWDLSGENQINDWGIDLSTFTAPVFNNEPWSFSYADPTAVSQDTHVLLSNHGKIIMAQRKDGNGLVIWSGMNFPYHALKENNTEEIKLFGDLITESKIALVNNNQFMTSTDFKRPAQNHVIINGQGAKGVLFKEAAYPGWKAVVKSGNTSKSLRIYQAGPMQPGYVYVVVPADMSSNAYSVDFKFYNSWTTWIPYFLNLVGILLTLDLMTGKWILKTVAKHTSPHRKKVARWWDKEEDY